MKLKAKPGNVIIKQLEEEEQHHGNIIVADISKEGEKKGKVIDVGAPAYSPFGDLIPVTTELGEIVVYPTFGGQRVVIDGDEYFVFKEKDLLAYLIEEDKPIVTL